MTLLVSVVFLDVVQEVSSDDDGSVHLGGDADSSKKGILGISYLMIFPLIET